MTSIEPLTDVLSPVSMRSCLFIPRALLAHGGPYVCHVHEGVQDQSATATVNITVLGKTQPKERDRESKAWTESQRTPITVDG